MEETDLDFVLVPCGLMVMAVYHVWLLHRVIHFPSRTVIGLNALNRQQWVSTMMADPMKNGVLAVQTIRNNIMASTVLASTAITLSSIIGVLVRTSSDPSAAPLVVGNRSATAVSVKYFAVLTCFLLAFLCNVQSLRYYGHVSFLVSTQQPETTEGEVGVEYIGRALNRGSYFWSLGLRAFYLSFPLLLWTFGPIPMLACSCVLVALLFFLDSTTDFSRRFFCLPELGTKSSSSVPAQV
ncbi:uncharacterized protein LOC116264641 [Nymphaea colorata]|nr:uncharacterized protein LOC116264641 [Nymphaea colorata]